jgi:hypothetical protein
MPVKQIATKHSIRHRIEAPVVKTRLPNKKNILKIAGCLSTADAVELKSIIEQGCERIEQNAWKNLH